MIFGNRPSHQNVLGSPDTTTLNVPFTARAWFSVFRLFQKSFNFDMKMSIYFDRVNCVFQLNDGLSSDTKVKGARPKQKTVF